MDTLQLLPGQSVNLEMAPVRSKTTRRRAAMKETESPPKREAPTLGEVRSEGDVSDRCSGSQGRVDTGVLRVL